MSKARGITLIRGKEPVLKVAACGVEYDSGELYWDRTGRVIRNLSKSGRGWVQEATVTASKTQILNPTHGLMALVTPSGAGVTLNVEGTPRAIEPEEIEVVASHAAHALGTVADEYEMTHYQRIGYREQWLFPCDSVEESEEWLKGLGLVRVHDSLYETFGRHYALSTSIVTAGEECRFRIELHGIERQASVPVGPAEMLVKHSRAKHLKRDELLKALEMKRHRQTDPEYAVVVDIDAFLWDDTPVDFDIAGFVRRRAGDNLESFRRCLEKASS